MICGRNSYLRESTSPKTEKRDSVKKIIFTIVILSCAYSPCFSQQEKWTFQECVKYALEHNPNIRSQKIEIRNAELNVKTARQNRLPNLDLGLTQHFQLGKNLTVNNGYQTNNQSNTGIVLESEFLLFAGFQAKHRIAIENLNLDISLSCLEKAEKDVTLQIALQFLQILFYKELEKIHTEQIELTREQVTNTENLIKLGRVPQSYIYDVKAELASNEFALTQSSVKEQESLLLLKQLLDLSDFQKFDIEIPVFDDIENSLLLLPLPDSIYSAALAFFPEIKMARQQLDVSRTQLLLSKSAYYPSISMYANYNNGYSHIFNTENRRLKDQLKGNERIGAGLSVSMPLFDRFAAKNKVSLSKIVIESQTLRLENAERALYKEIQLAYFDAVTAIKKWESGEKNREALQIAFQHIEQRYNAGKGTVYELLEGKTKLTKATMEQSQIKYELLFRLKILHFYMGKEIEIH
jgi:outer membrane protein